MRAQGFKTKLLFINNIIHWFRSAILVDNRAFPIFKQKLKLIICDLWCNCEKEIKQKQTVGVLFYIQKCQAFLSYLGNSAYDLSARTNLHFVQHTNCVAVIRRIDFPPGRIYFSCNPNLVLDSGRIYFPERVY